MKSNQDAELDQSIANVARVLSEHNGNLKTHEVIQKSWQVILNRLKPAAESKAEAA